MSLGGDSKTVSIIDVTPAEKYAAARATKRKIGHLLLHDSLEHYLDADGNQLLDVVAAEHKHVTAQKKYISPAFWDGVIEAFQLKKVDWSDLPDVPNANADDEFIDEHVGDMVVKAFGTNPAWKAKGIQLLENRLQRRDRLAMWQIRNLLVLSADSKDITHKHSAKLQHAILRHMSARHGTRVS